MYRYKMTITTSNKIEDLDKYSDDIKRCVTIYNKRSERSKNRKHIEEPIEIFDTHMIVILQSDNPLQTPLKALWLFSKLLLKESELGKYSTGTRFLKPLKIECISSGATKQKISNEDALKKLVEIYVTNEDDTDVLKNIKTEVVTNINEYILEYIEKTK